MGCAPSNMAAKSGSNGNKWYTPEDYEIVQRSWEIIKQGPAHLHARNAPFRHESCLMVSPIGHLFNVYYQVLFGAVPSARGLFKHSLPKLATAMTQMFEELLTLTPENVNSSQRRARLVALGARHVDYDVPIDLVKAFEDVLVQVIEEVLGSDFSPEMGPAWRHLYKAAIFHIVWGMEHPKAARSKKSSNWGACCPMATQVENSQQSKTPPRGCPAHKTSKSQVVPASSSPNSIQCAEKYATNGDHARTSCASSQPVPTSDDVGSAETIDGGEQSCAQGTNDSIIEGTNDSIATLPKECNSNNTSQVISGKVKPLTPQAEYAINNSLERKEKRTPFLENLVYHHKSRKQCETSA